MMRTVGLRREPSVRQTAAILARIEGELATCGAVVERDGPAMLRFRIPPPWRAPKLGVLLAITSGRATMSAGAGERWRIRYELHFRALMGLTLVLSAALVLVGWWAWARVSLLNALLLLWAVLYGLPYLFANVRFRRIVESAAHEIVEGRPEGRGEGLGTGD